MTTLIGRTLRSLDKFWWNIRLFAFRNRTIFEIMFLSLYTIEQGALIYFVSINQLSSSLVSYFALIVLLTFGLHKIVMESRAKILDMQLRDLRMEYDLVKTESKEIIRHYKEIIEVYSRPKR